MMVPALTGAELFSSPVERIVERGVISISSELVTISEAD